MRSAMSAGGSWKTSSSGRKRYSIGSGNSFAARNITESLPSWVSSWCIPSSEPSASPSGPSWAVDERAQLVEAGEGLLDRPCRRAGRACRRRRSRTAHSMRPMSGRLLACARVSILGASLLPGDDLELDLDVRDAAAWNDLVDGLVGGVVEGAGVVLDVDELDGLGARRCLARPGAEGRPRRRTARAPLRSWRRLALESTSLIVESPSWGHPLNAIVATEPLVPDLQLLPSWRDHHRARQGRHRRGSLVARLARPGDGIDNVVN